jgi:hypothetical protein
MATSVLDGGDGGTIIEAAGIAMVPNPHESGSIGPGCLTKRCRKYVACQAQFRIDSSHCLNHHSNLPMIISVSAWGKIRQSTADWQEQG